MEQTRRVTRKTNAPHGTMTRYNAGCSCLACCDVKKAWQAEYKAEGQNRRVDVAPVRARLHELYAQGWSRGAISAATGIQLGSLRVIDGTAPSRRASGDAVTTQVRRDHAEAIMACDGALPGRYAGLIPVGPTRRLLRRMTKRMTNMAIARGTGLSKTAIADLLGTSAHPVERVRARTALRIEEFAEAQGFTRRNEAATLRLVPEAFDQHLEVNGWDLNAVLEAVGMPFSSYQQIRSGRPLGEERAERLAIVMATRIDTLFEAVA